LAQEIPFPEERTKEVDLFPKPVDGYLAQINPPGFSWLEVDGAEFYVVTIQKAYDREVIIQSEKIHDYVFVPNMVSGATIFPSTGSILFLTCTEL